MSADNDVKFDYMYKIMAIGNAFVGKTAYISRYCGDPFNPAYISTVGIDFKVKSLISNDKPIKVQIWDTSGQERYHSIATAYYRGAMGFIVMFDLTNEETFAACRMWIQQIKELSLENPVILLVGNKLDLTEQRAVSNEDAMKLASSMGATYFETSAKDDTNVNESFQYLVDAITEMMQKLSVHV